MFKSGFKSHWKSEVRQQLLMDLHGLTSLLRTVTFPKQMFVFCKCVFYWFTFILLRFLTVLLCRSFTAFQCNWKFAENKTRFDVLADKYLSPAGAVPGCQSWGQECKSSSSTTPKDTFDQPAKGALILISFFLFASRSGGRDLRVLSSSCGPDRVQLTFRVYLND